MADEAKRPKVGLGAILLGEGEKVLLGKRGSGCSHGVGKWSFPGGHLEYLEGFVQCAEREMLEETGLKRKIDYAFIDSEACAVTNNFFPEGRHDITLYLRAEHLNGIPKIMEPEKCDEWRWYEWSKLSELDLFVPIRNLLLQKYSPYA